MKMLSRTIGGPKMPGNFVRERQRIVYIYNIHIHIYIYIYNIIYIYIYIIYIYIYNVYYICKQYVAARARNFQTFLGRLCLNCLQKHSPIVDKTYVSPVIQLHSDVVFYRLNLIYKYTADSYK